MGSFSNGSQLDNLMLQTLMGRLHIRPPTTTNNHRNNPFASQSLEDILLDAIDDLSENVSDESDDDSKTPLAREESKLEKEIIRVILSGKADALKPNSGQAVTIGDHHVCVGYQEESGSDYRVWEWHGHLMLFDEENGYTPEYIYGNYFERIVGAVKSVPRGRVVKEVEKEEEDDEEEERAGSLGLRELIDGGDSGPAARILHRNVNTGPSRSD